ncbi:Creatinase/aminopeptidase [Pseudovirgaria hyperparasitica]|uniref:Creatinase/aminopeptidase n=1 Tax=Pseudovirgaria hyperparasitica TaxID=470096 RepID=A0A6A6WJF0_9PEZI|nr:Creatinase/aminopeptidase [Pseudovirgaria hyperparasitica]KAF2761451.1 Creatinase/aminopeptidase [Pseudovirgaria hyperparasitica]
MMTSAATTAEQERAAALRDAETKAIQMFEEISRTLIKPGQSEKAVSDKIHELGKERYGVRTHWHKRLIRSGPNTLLPFRDSPPDRIIEEDDILVIDLGPVFEAWEADFGRSYVLGNDPEKKKLANALDPMWHKIKAMYQQRPDMTGGELYEIAVSAAKEDGWEWNADIAGHIVGDFPHERIPNNKITHYITSGNTQSMASMDKKGHRLHWILEVHLRHPSGEFAGFFEQLLTVD